MMTVAPGAMHAGRNDRLIDGRANRRQIAITALADRKQLDNLLDGGMTEHPRMGPSGRHIEQRLGDDLIN